MSTIYNVATSNTMKMQTGQFGVKVATGPVDLPDLSLNDPPEYFYGIIKALADAVLTITVRPSVVMGDKTLTAYPLKVGDTIAGRFDKITVTSGKVLIYYGKEEKAQ